MTQTKLKYQKQVEYRLKSGMGWGENLKKEQHFSNKIKKQGTFPIFPGRKKRSYFISRLFLITEI